MEGHVHTQLAHARFAQWFRVQFCHCNSGVVPDSMKGQVSARFCHTYIEQSLIQQVVLLISTAWLGEQGTTPC